MMSWLLAAKVRMDALAADMAQAPLEWQAWIDALAISLMSGTGVRAVTYCLILLLIAGSVEWLFWTYAYGPLRALQATLARSAREALALSLRRLLLLCSGVLLFTGASIAASAVLSWPEGVQEAVLDVSLWLMVLRLAWAVAEVVLAPGRSARRLVPVRADHVPWLMTTVLLVAFFGGAARFLPELVEQIGQAPHSAGVLRLALATLTTLLLLVAAFGFMGRPPRLAAPHVRLPAFPRSFPAAALVLLGYSVWLLGSPALSGVTMVLAVVLVLQMVLRDAVFYFWSARWDMGAGLAGAAATAVAANQLLPHIVLSASRFGVVAIGLGACAIALDTPLHSSSKRRRLRANASRAERASVACKARSGP